jgi:hypothetical protein
MLLNTDHKIISTPWFHDFFTLFSTHHASNLVFLFFHLRSNRSRNLLHRLALYSRSLAAYLCPGQSQAISLETGVGRITSGLCRLPSWTVLPLGSCLNCGVIMRVLCSQFSINRNVSILNRRSRAQIQLIAAKRTEFGVQAQVCTNSTSGH